MLPDEPTEEERQEELPQDNETPFQPAAPNPDPTGIVGDPVAQPSNDGALDDTHPVTDSNIQPEEAYDEGVAGAAEAGEPNIGNAVTGFIPTDNQAADDVAGSDNTAETTGTTPGEPGL